MLELKHTTTRLLVSSETTTLTSNDYINAMGFITSSQCTKIVTQFTRH